MINGGTTGDNRGRRVWGAARGEVIMSREGLGVGGGQVMAMGGSLVKQEERVDTGKGDMGVNRGRGSCHPHIVPSCVPEFCWEVGCCPSTVV